jgi:hypothetical protein
MQMRWLLVVVIVLVLVHRAQPPRAEAAADAVLEGVVVCLVGRARLLVGAIQAVADVGQVVSFEAPSFAVEVDADAVIPVLVEDPDDSEVHLVELEAWPLFELLADRALPLRAGDCVEASVLQALHAAPPRARSGSRRTRAALPRAQP